MTVSEDKLVRMANDIANFFKPYGEAKAVEGVRHHIASFWTPKMRAGLLDQIARGAATGVDPIVDAAMRGPQTEGGPAQRESAGPAVAGELGASDAG